MKKFYLSALLFLLALGACAPATMQLDSSLAQHATAMPVTGKQGWQLNQVLSFGGFHTGKVERGWTFSYEVPFILTFQGAREKLGFQQFDGSGRVADVYLVNSLRNDELPLLKDFFSLSIVDETALSGSIVTDTDVWDFLVYVPSPDLRERSYEGFVSTGTTVFDVTEVKTYANTPDEPAPSSGQALGYEFRVYGQVVGAVEVINGGKVWLDERLSEDQRLVLASVASALLLRSDVSDVL